MNESNQTVATIDSLVLEQLRLIRATLNNHTDSFNRIESRLGSLELTVAGMRRDIAHMYGDIVEQNIRYDQFHSRIERIEKRLELS